MPWQDHPRSRGKDSARLTASRIRSGSPPLARERPAAIPANAWTRRITPARAGKTDSTHGSAHTARDHPRSRGKDYIRRRMIPGCCGSPPLARERPGVSAGDVLYQGITPARAGKTGLRSPRLHSPWDHPRSRGKDTLSCTRTLLLLGSPPLARERPGYSSGATGTERITPARAGKTPRQPHEAAMFRDHPRSRGKD